MLTEEAREGLQRALSTVRDLMTTQLVTLEPTQSMFEAINLFGQRQFRHILVTEGGRLVGVLSDRDALRFFVRHGVSGDSTVAAVMTDNPVTIGPAASAAEATGLIIKHRINCLPVVEHDELCGILTTTDLLRALFTLQNWLERRVGTTGGRT